MTQSRELSQWTHSAASNFDVAAREFVVATADIADLKSFTPLCSVLRRMRNTLGIEGAFIAEAVYGETVVRQQDGDDPAECETLHVLFGTSLLGGDTADGRACGFDAVPVITRDGLQHGTLCCRSTLPGDAPQRDVMHAVARLIANWFEQAAISMSGFAPLGGQSVMGGLSARAF
jgi:hypothetical protein